MSGISPPEVSSRLGELKEELWGRLNNACGPLVDWLDGMFSDDIYHAEIYYAFDVYRYLIFAREEVDYLDFIRKDVLQWRMSEEEIKRRVDTFDEEKMKSVMRVIETCNLEQKLVDFIPSLKEELEEWKEEAKKMKLDASVLERLKEISLKEFISEDMLNGLEESCYEELADSIAEALENDNRFRNTLMKEMEEQARRLLDATNREINNLFMCLVEC